MPDIIIVDGRIQLTLCPRPEVDPETGRDSSTPDQRAETLMVALEQRGYSATIMTAKDLDHGDKKIFVVDP